MAQPQTAILVGQKWLVWLLLVAVAVMGLTITRQQALGSLHSHPDQRPRLSTALRAAASSLGNDWARRWQQQQVNGHGQLLLGTAAYGTLWQSDKDNTAAASATRVHDDHKHSHDSLERHHHGAHDASVVALDGAAELVAASDSPASGVPLLLLGIGAPSAGLVLQATTSHIGTWPQGRFAALASRSVPPLLRPPSA